MAEKSGIKIAAQNRKAHHDYFVEDRFEAGIELFGTEVKSIRAGTLNLKDAYCIAKNGEIYVHGMHITGDQQAPGPSPAGRHGPGTPERLFQKRQGEGGGGALPGQEKL